MTMTAMPMRVALSAIDVGENVRELDETHVDALARSIALRGLISPLTVRPGKPGRFVLVAGRHRYTACAKLDLEEVEVVVRDVESTSADTAAENIVRKQLSPLGEARAVGAMLDEALTFDGAAEALGWTRGRLGMAPSLLRTCAYREACTERAPNWRLRMQLRERDVAY